MPEATMAKPKKKAAKKADPGFKTVGVRSSNEWAEWVEAAARHYRTTVAGLIDRALSEWTEANGYPVRPPERLP